MKFSLSMKPKLNFEASFKKLEEAVKRLETGDMALEESLKVFEEGMTLAASCQKTLKETETKIEKLIENFEGQSQTVAWNLDKTE